MPLTAIEPRRLYRQVADQLRGLIERGEYSSGDRLPPERELSERLGISRPTVREALIALEVEGWVRIRVGSGIYVTAREPAATGVRIEADGPFEILGARELIESAVAAQAATLAGPHEVATLDEVLAEAERGGHPSPETIALDRLFHVGVAGIVGNPVVTRLVGELFDKRMSPYFERLSGYFENGASWRLAHDEHRLVRDAIANGNAAAASAAMRAHLEKSQLRFQTGFGDAEPGRTAAAMAAAREAAPPLRRGSRQGRKPHANEEPVVRSGARRAGALADGRLRPGDDA
ncbi:FadR/GntR family transcriptional regulator [Aureimonas leprariae]|uniref:FadR family transcriptional regulator n=1 Tax=Plantimonas leprariae TaxID=2615207 RepID=A0A7V7PRR4_9HYPH|nr:GntR family transcriptional regulator [Aureimonas leprariae]KAB0681398.1 FadR family transcriptional regulator [Aureimonas leprariae]